MTDGQSLLLLFVALYFIESLRWLPARSYLLIGSGQHWHGQRPFQPTELAGGCPALMSILPPLQAHLATLPWQLIPATEGLEIHADDRRPQILPWAEVKPNVRGRSLYLDSRSRVRYLSEDHAREAQQQVLQWQSQPQEQRAADFLKYARQTLKEEPLRTQAAQLTGQTRLLRHLGSLIFVLAFMVIASLYRWLGESPAVYWAVGGLFTLQFTQAFFFYRRGQGVPYRFWKALAVALMPQHAMRAADHLCDAPALSPSHPLATRTLIPEEAWKKLAREVWKKARYTPSLTADLQCQALEAFLKKQNMPIAELEPVPEQQTGSVSYCPNCQSQFQAEARVCQDCGGVQLRPF